MPLATPPGASAPLYARNKVTGETYYVGSNVNLIDDLGDVDTSTTGPTGGNALIWDETLGQWVPGVASTVASLDDLTDVTTMATGPTGPTGPSHGQVLTWDETLGQWVPGASASEVETGATLPTGSWELWVDTAPLSPPTAVINDLADVDTATSPPADKKSLVWNNTAGQWVPGDAAITAAYGLVVADNGSVKIDTALLDARYAKRMGDLDDVYMPLEPADGTVLMYNEGAHKWQAEFADALSEVEIGPTEPTGAWELWVDEAPAAAPRPSDEVWVGPDDPRLIDPVNTHELWYDTGTGTLKAWSGGAWVDASYPSVKIVGDTMTGLLTLSGDPTVDLHAVTKRYVDQRTTAPGTTVAATLQNGFTGTAEVRHSAGSVTCRFEDVKRPPGVLENQRIKVFDYPAGVPGPWGTLIMAAHALSSGDTATPAWQEECEVHFAADGVWIQAYDNRPISAEWTVSASASWTK